MLLYIDGCLLLLIHPTAKIQQYTESIIKIIDKMYMKHHQRSITLMGCLDQLARTHKLQQNLSRIHNHGCPCQSPKNAQSNRDASLNHTLNLTTGPHLHPPEHHNNNSNVCLALREEKNRRLLEMRRNGYVAQATKKEKEVLQQNRKIVTKLINVKSQLQELYQDKDNNGDGLGYYGTMVIGSGGKGYRTGSIRIRDSSPARDHVSSSAVNRHKKLKQIVAENQGINKRIQSAMSKSSYSQGRLRKGSKIERNGYGYGSKSGYGGNWMGVKEQEMRKTMSQIQSKRNNVLFQRDKNKEQQKQPQGWQSQPNNFNAEQNDHLQRTQTEKTQYFYLKDRAGNRINSQPSQNKNKSISNAKGLQNQLTRLYQHSINYVQNGQYASQKQREKDRGTGFTQRIVRRLNTHTANPSNKDYSPYRLHPGQFLQQRESDSVVKMRKAAMLHFRKVQKMKATQSRVWQVKDHKKNINGSKNGTGKGNDWESSYKNIKNQDIVGDNYRSILLTGLN